MCCVQLCHFSLAWRSSNSRRHFSVLVHEEVGRSEEERPRLEVMSHSRREAKEKESN